VFRFAATVRADRANQQQDEGRNAIGTPILTSGVLPGSQGLNGLQLELIATRAVVLVVSVDVAARRQTGGGIARDELNNRRRCCES
jgi:hypothetical protein